MAVIDTTNNQAATQGAPSFASAASGQQQQTQQPVGNTFGWSNLGNLLERPMSLNSTSEILGKTKKAFDTLISGLPKSRFSVDLLTIDHESAMQIGISALVIVVGQANANSARAFHTMLVEGSIEPPASGIEQTQQGNIEILRTAADFNNVFLLNEVQSNLKRLYPQCALYNADASLLPRDFNFDDARLCWNALSNAVDAASTELNVHAPGFEDLNLFYIAKDASLQVQKQFGNMTFADAVGLPVNAEVVITMKAVANVQTGQNAPGVAAAPARAETLTEATGYVDLVWAFDEPAGMGTVPYGYGQPQQMPQRYLPRFVITQMQCAKVSTLATQLLSILPVLTLRDNNRWMQGLLPIGFNNDDVDLRDFGATGLEVPYMPAEGLKRIDTKEANFNEASLCQLISFAVKPNLLISLDVPECGATTWKNSIFAAAAAGNPEANALIINASQQLTNGNFGKYFNGTQVAVNEQNRIHTGYYHDKAGKKIDLRTVGYLAMLNLTGDKDKSIVEQFSNTYAAVGTPLNIRLARRKQILCSVLGENNIVFTGFAARVTFTPEFLNALVRGAADAGLIWREIDNARDLTGHTRSRVSLGEQFYNQESFAGQLNRGFGTPQQAGNVAGTFGTRWS
jgi:hypothetical protein